MLLALFWDIYTDHVVEIPIYSHFSKVFFFRERVVNLFTAFPRDHIFLFMYSYVKLQLIIF